MRNIILAFILILLCVFSGFSWAKYRLYQAGYKSVCSLVYKKIFLHKEITAPWYKECLSSSKAVALTDSKQNIITYIQSSLDQLNSSHLYVQTPIQRNYQERGEVLSTGIKAHWVEDVLVVKKVIIGSSAYNRGLLRGDILVSVNGAPMTDSYESFYKQGHYIIKRVREGESRELKFNIKKTKNHESMNLELTELNSSLALLKVPSFYSKILQKKGIIKMGKSLSGKNHIIIDWRGNGGGHVLSALRLLSLFTCKGQIVGEMIKPHSPLNKFELLKDLDDFGEQYFNFYNLKKIKLQTFGGYGCFKGKVSVVVDEETGSAAEIFALGLQELKQAKVWGSESSGQAVMALRYSLSELGQGFAVTVPEAMYRSDSGAVIEGQGVYIDEHYDLSLTNAVSGKDALIEEVVNSN